MLVRSIVGSIILGCAATVGADSGANASVPYKPGVPAQAPSTGEDAQVRPDDEHSRRGDQPRDAVRVLFVAPRRAELSSQMEGRITSVPLDIGDAFSRGDRLVAFECDHQLAERDAAAAELTKARKTFESQQALQHLDAVSELDVSLAEAEVKVARANLEKARARVKDCEITAPYEGRVVRVMANEFESVRPGASLIEVIETGALRLEALVPSRWLVWLREGMVFDVKVDETGQTVQARITALGARVDPVSQSLSIRARIDHPPPGLLPGMSGNADFSVAEKHE